MAVVIKFIEKNKNLDLTNTKPNQKNLLTMVKLSDNSFSG